MFSFLLTTVLSGLIGSGSKCKVSNVYFSPSTSSVSAIKVALPNFSHAAFAYGYNLRGGSLHLDITGFNCFC